MYELFIQFAGWIPAIILPSATFIQLLKIIRMKTAEGVCLLTWSLFFLANTGLYIYTGKYFELQSILSLLLTALLDLLIVFMSINYKLRDTKKSRITMRENAYMIDCGNSIAKDMAFMFCS